MPEIFEPRFVDLVRQHSLSTGTDSFMLDSVPAGFTGFTEALQAGDQFYYSAVGIDKPFETEVGVGTLQADGSITREAAGGAATVFSGGLTAVSLVVGAPWFDAGGQHKAIGNGAKVRTLKDKLSDTISVKDYGAVGDGVTDDTPAFNAALAALSESRTSPSGYAGWGMGCIHIPRGNYRIEGTVAPVSPIGVRFIGDGEFSSNILCPNDSGSVFALTTYVGVTFEHLSFIHETTSDRGTWSNVLFDMDGGSGGRQLRLLNCSTDKFGTVLRFNDLINEDTTFAQCCTFRDFGTFLEGTNSQAVGNSFIHCSWSGETNRGFYIAGHGNTLIESGNVAMDGPLIELRDVASKYDRNGFTLVNTKFEWTAANNVAGSPPKIIDGESIHAICNLSMRDCSLYGGPTPHSDARWAKFGFGGANIDISGGRLDGKLEVVKFTTYRPEKAPYVRLAGVQISDPADWVFSGSTPGAVWPAIALTDCSLAGQNPINLTLTNGEGIPSVDPARTLILSKHNTALPAFYPGVTVIDHDFHGEKVHLKSIKWMVRSAAASATPRSVRVYGDQARSQLLATLDLPTAGMSNDIHSIILPDDNLIVDGVYLDVDCPSGAPTMRGFAIVDIVSV